MSKELVIEFASFLKTANRSESTIIAYTKDLAQLIEYSEVKVHDLDRETLAELMKKLTNEFGFTPKTVSRKLNSYRIFYKFLMGKGELSHNPADQVEHPKFAAKVPRVLSPVEYLALREVTRDNKRLFAMIETMLQTGIRIGEISRVKIKDLKLDGAKPSLFIEEFSTNPAREVPLTPKLANILSEHAKSLPTRLTAESPLFPTREGRAIIVRNIRSSVDRAMLKAGITNACVNDLRNTFIVAQLQAGVPIDVVAEIVGHRSRVTTNKYLDLLDKPYQPKGDARIVEL